MNTQLAEINHMLRLMDNSITKTLETNDVNDLEDYNINLHKLRVMQCPNPWTGAKPINPYRGHLHVDEDLIYLLSFIK